MRIDAIPLRTLSELDKIKLSLVVLLIAYQRALISSQAHKRGGLLDDIEDFFNGGHDEDDSTGDEISDEDEEDEEGELIEDEDDSSDEQEIAQDSDDDFEPIFPDDGDFKMIKHKS